MAELQTAGVDVDAVDTTVVAAAAVVVEEMRLLVASSLLLGEVTPSTLLLDGFLSALLPAGTAAVVVVVVVMVAGACCVMLRDVCAFTVILEARGTGDATGTKMSPSASEDELCGKRRCLCWALSSGDASIVHTRDALMNESMGTS